MSNVTPPIKPCLYAHRLSDSHADPKLHPTIRYVDPVGYAVVCSVCHYQGPDAPELAQAVALHNQMYDIAGNIATAVDDTSLSDAQIKGLIVAETHHEHLTGDESVCCLILKSGQQIMGCGHTITEARQQAFKQIRALDRRSITPAPNPDQDVDSPQVDRLIA